MRRGEEVAEHAEDAELGLLLDEGGGGAPFHLEDVLGLGLGVDDLVALLVGGYPGPAALELVVELEEAVVEEVEGCLGAGGAVGHGVDVVLVDDAVGDCACALGVLVVDLDLYGVGLLLVEVGVDVGEPLLGGVVGVADVGREVEVVLGLIERSGGDGELSQRGGDGVG